jgi:glycerophosphoryl diester phosphodiesterase
VVENTLPAFAAALELGAHYLETDVHGSKDGIAVVSHDPDLSRLAGESGLVSERTLAELQRIPLGPATIPSLAEVLDAFPEARFNIDIKSADAVPGAIDAIRATGAQQRVLVTSFSDRRRRAVVSALPGVATSASAGSFLRALVAGKAGVTGLLRSALAGVDAVQVPERVLSLAVTTERFVGRLHAAGVEIHVWTINDPADMERLLDLGVDGLVTDRTDLAMRVLGTL